MTCGEVRSQLLDAMRGRLEEGQRAEVAAHVDACASCASIERSERALDEALARERAATTAPASLKRRLALLAGPAQRTPVRRATRRRLALSGFSAAAALAMAVAGGAWWQGTRSADRAAFTAELVVDHLRVIAREHPIDVESHGAHEVKPWFEGKLDFAPVVPVPEVPDLRLRGGAVGYVFDRKAAVVVYGLRLHAVTLLAFRADRDWPWSGQLAPAVRRHDMRGFHVAWWRAGEVGYALVSDVDAEDLMALADRFAAATGSGAGR